VLWRNLKKQLNPKEKIKGQQNGFETDSYDALVRKRFREKNKKLAKKKITKNFLVNKKSQSVRVRTKTDRKTFIMLFTLTIHEEGEAS
jgi:hypothetical protein